MRSFEVFDAVIQIMPSMNLRKSFSSFNTLAIGWNSMVITGYDSIFSWVYNWFPYWVTTLLKQILFCSIAWYWRWNASPRLQYFEKSSSSLLGHVKHMTLPMIQHVLHRCENSQQFGII